MLHLYRYMHWLAMYKVNSMTYYLTKTLWTYKKEFIKVDIYVPDDFKEKFS